MFKTLSSHRQALASLFMMLWLCFAVMSFCQWMMAQSASAELSTSTQAGHHVMMTGMSMSDKADMPCCESQEPPCCGPTDIVPVYDILSWLNMLTVALGCITLLLIGFGRYSQHYRRFTPLVPPPPRLILCRLLI